MTQERHSPQTLTQFKTHRALIASGLTCLSGFSLLSISLTANGLAANAQTQEQPPVDAPAVPAAQDLLAPAAAPVVIPDAPVAPEPAPEPAFSGEVLPEPEAIAPVEIPRAAPAPLVAPDLSERAGGLNDQSYIDTTPYDIGATRYEAPGSIVVSERSSGCQAVMANGQAPNSICAQPAAPSFASGGYAENGAGGGIAASAPAGGGDLGAVVNQVYNVVTGRTTPSGSDYYNLTARPPARLGTSNNKMMFPLSMPAMITSLFGWRVHPVAGYSRFHSGTDLGADEGTPVLAAFPGKVAIADFMGGYGLTVVLRHNQDAEETLYAHMSEIFVKPGEEVKQGEVIGRVGSTGVSTGPHLHFEFRQKVNEGWVAIDPGLALENSLTQFITALKLGKSPLDLTTAANPIDPLQRLKQIMQETKVKGPKNVAQASPANATLMPPDSVPQFIRQLGEKKAN
jgi:murein DD-endopeptidase MepM/ murein hydrolase activator NlpD